MINPKNLKKSILDYAIRGELSAKFRRENQTAVGWASLPTNNAKGVDKATIVTEHSNLSLTPNGAMVGKDAHPTSCNDGVLTAFDEIAAYNAKTAKIKAQREKLLDRIEKQLKAEKGTKRKKDTVIASRQTFVGGETAYECVAQSEAKGLMRGNLLTMENAPNLHSDKGIATTATQSRNDSFPAQEVLSGASRHSEQSEESLNSNETRDSSPTVQNDGAIKTPEQRTEQLKRISGSLKNKIKTYRTITPLNQNPDFTPPFAIPKEWAWVKLGEIGVWKSGSTPSREKSEFYINGTINWLKTGDLNDGFIYQTEEKVTEQAVRKTNLNLNKIGSVLIAMYGATIGRIGIAQIPLTTNQACCACDCNALIFNKYLFYFLLQAREYFLSIAFGSGQPNISKEKITETPIPLPPLAEQQFIAGQLEQALTACEQYESTVNALLNLEDGLFNKISKSVLDYAIHGELSAKYRRENQTTVGWASLPTKFYIY